MKWFYNWTMCDPLNIRHIRYSYPHCTKYGQPGEKAFEFVITNFKFQTSKLMCACTYKFWEIIVFLQDKNVNICIYPRPRFKYGGSPMLTWFAAVSFLFNFFQFYRSSVEELRHQINFLGNHLHYGSSNFECKYTDDLNTWFFWRLDFSVSVIQMVGPFVNWTGQMIEQQSSEYRSVGWWGMK